MSSSTVQIFIAYAPQDTAYLKELKKYLAPLERTKTVGIWYDGEIEAGAEWEKSISLALHNLDEVFEMMLCDNKVISRSSIYRVFCRENINQVPQEKNPQHLKQMVW